MTSSDEQQYSFGILTLSDKGSQGKREDTSGEYLRERLTTEGFQEAAYLIIGDQEELIAKTLTKWVDHKKIDLIITTGGTGVSPRDLTPEATASIIDRELPGFCEAMRAASLQITPNAMISRGISGTRKMSLIINLPGSKKAAMENLETVVPALRHAIYKIKGGSKDCATEC